jgi:GNAT superfamily N-acetyltransferase
MSVVVRLAQHRDVREIVALVSEVLAEFGLTFGQGSATDAELWELPDAYERRDGRFWVAIDDDAARVIGTCALFPLAPGVLELRKMYLAPASRGRGVGELLWQAASSWARAQRATSVVLDTAEQMTSAIRFYERHGFVRDDAQVRGSRCSRGYRLTLA